MYKILLIQACLEMQRIYKAYFKKRGFHVLVASGGSEASRMLLRHGFQVVLVLAHEDSLSVPELEEFVAVCDENTIPLLLVSSEYEWASRPEDLKRLIKNWLRDPETATRLKSVMDGESI